MQPYCYRLLLLGNRIACNLLISVFTIEIPSESPASEQMNITASKAFIPSQIGIVSMATCNSWLVSLLLS